MFDLAAEVTMSWGESDRSHNDAATGGFLPRKVVLPERSYGVSLGWSALQILGGTGDQGTEVRSGPIYVEAQRAGRFWGVGGGWAVRPTNGDHGPQLNAFLGVAFLRTRYLFGGGFEFQLGYQLKIPVTWVTSR